jgi:hypothetical protein
MPDQLRLRPSHVPEMRIFLNDPDVVHLQDEAALIRAGSYDVIKRRFDDKKA